MAQQNGQTDKALTDDIDSGFKVEVIKQGYGSYDSYYVTVADPELVQAAATAMTEHIGIGLRLATYLDMGSHSSGGNKVRVQHTWEAIRKAALRQNASYLKGLPAGVGKQMAAMLCKERLASIDSMFGVDSEGGSDDYPGKDVTIEPLHQFLEKSKQRLTQEVDGPSPTSVSDSNEGGLQNPSKTEAQDSNDGGGVRKTHRSRPRPPGLGLQADTSPATGRNPETQRQLIADAGVSMVYDDSPAAKDVTPDQFLEIAEGDIATAQNRAKEKFHALDPAEQQVALDRAREVAVKVDAGVDKAVAKTAGNPAPIKRLPRIAP